MLQMLLGMDYLTPHMTNLHAYLIVTTNVLTDMHVSNVLQVLSTHLLLPIVTKTNGGNIFKQPR